MNLLKRLSLILLAALMCMGTFACASPDTGEETTADTAPSTSAGSNETAAGSSESVEVETVITDSLPELNYDGEEFTIFCQKGLPDLIGDVEGDVVEATVYERNLMVEKRLGVKLVMMEEDAVDPIAVLQTIIMANDDVVDLAAGMQYQAIQQAYKNLYINMAEGEYLDWEKPWWADSYMDTIQWNEKRYILVGDISLSLLKSMSSFFVNKTLYEDNFGNPNNLYTMVFDGKWTWDQMTSYVAEVYNDKNNNGKTDDGDILGLRTYHESPTDHMAYTAGMTLSTRDENGDIVLLEDQSRNIEIAEAIYKLTYENKGCFLNMDYNSFEDHVINSFNDGNTLFCAYLMVAAENFRDMKDPYAIIPYPKLNEDQETYQTLMHDIATVFAVPKTVSADKLDLHSAVLEAMCYESYHKVTPVYYDVVLKSRYSQDPDSARAVDMIRANIRTDFIYANNYIFPGTPLGTINRTLVNTANTNYASLYKKYSKRVKMELNKINDGDIKAD